MTVADNIKALRERFGVTQSELARVAGVTENAVSKWENGYSTPRMGAIERISACYGITKGSLIEDSGIKMRNGSSLSPDEEEVVDIMRSVTPEGRRQLMIYARGVQSTYSKNTKAVCA